MVVRFVPMPPELKSASGIQQSGQRSLERFELEMAENRFRNSGGTGGAKLPAGIADGSGTALVSLETALCSSSKRLAMIRLAIRTIQPASCAPVP
jgi:hypothetical protein